MRIGVDAGNILQSSLINNLHAGQCVLVLTDQSIITSQTPDAYLFIVCDYRFGMGYTTKTLFLLLSLLMSLSASHQQSESGNMNKVKFDLSVINDHGLVGPSSGLRSMSYEFCIPLSDDASAQVLNIDSTIQIYQSGRGRVKCPPDMQLCIAETYNEDKTEKLNGIPHWKVVLSRLSDLEFVDSFVASYGE